MWSDAVSSLSVYLDAFSEPATVVVWKVTVRDRTGVEEVREGRLGTWFDAVAAGRDAFIGIGGRLAVLDAPATFRSASWYDDTQSMTLTTAGQNGTTEWTVGVTTDALHSTMSGTSSGWDEAIDAARKALHDGALAGQSLVDELYATWKRNRVVEDPAIMAGAPTFRGSRLLVTKIGASLQRSDQTGLIEREVRVDYPYLTDEDLIFARRFTQLSRP